MASRADLVLVSSSELLKRRGSPNPRTFLVPHGGPPPTPQRPPPPEAERIARPRIGFVGTISDWLDIDLLIEVASARPDWSFVFVGPRRARVDRLEGLPNVTLTGPRRHEDVGGFLEGFDVALIPYRIAPATVAASPIKLHEYLAHGLPVVSTDLPEVRPFSPPVEVAADAASFLAAIERSLRRGRSPAPGRGVRWEERVDEMIGLVAGAL